MYSFVLFLAAAAAVEGLTLPDKECHCPPLKHITCKKGQRLDTFRADDKCGCKLQRCLWNVCPKASTPNCGTCETLITVDNCGCKDFQCVATSPNHCPVTKVVCDKCHTIKQTKNECGCLLDKCVPLSLGLSHCHKCAACEECVSVDVGPDGCGYKEKMCRKRACPTMKEINCNDCEYAEVTMDKCGCPKMVCKKFESMSVKPTCSPCEEPKKVNNHKCGTHEWKCEPKDCPKAPKGHELCYKEAEKDECGCHVHHRKECQIVPAGKCPPGTAPMDGSDLCGCPHQTCVSCEEMYESPECKECEVAVNVTAADGKCVQPVCVKDPQCHLCDQLEANNADKNCSKCESLQESKVNVNDEVTCTVKVCKPNHALPGCAKCNKPKDIKCGKCTKPETHKDSNGCEVKVCVATEEPFEECFKPELCPTPKPAICFHKCQKPTIVKAQGCKVPVCTEKGAKDCEPVKKPDCGPCKQIKVDKDECGCPVFSCEAKACLLTNKMLLHCGAGKKQAQGTDSCGCVTPTCVEEKPFCKNNPFTPEFGKLLLRVSRGSGVDVYKALKEGGANVKDGEPEKYSDLTQNIVGGWVDRAAVNAWKAKFANGGKVRFTMWKKNKDHLEPVVDIIFNGKGSDIEGWFAKDRVEKVVKGPDVTKGAFNHWSMKGDISAVVDRNFLVCVKYDGCPGDTGMISINDRPDTCAAWMGGDGQAKIVPRFLYSRNGGACKFSDTGCMTDADVVTISVL